MNALPIMLGNGIPILYRTLSVEIPITSVAGNGTPFKFPENQILDTPGVKVYGLDAFIVTQQSVSPGGAAVVAAAGALGITVTLQDKKGVKRIENQPYYNFISALNTGYQRMFRPFQLVLQSSQIKITDGSGITVNEVALFQFLYYTPEDEQIFYESLKESKNKQAK